MSKNIIFFKQIFTSMSNNGTYSHFSFKVTQSLILNVNIYFKNIWTILIIYFDPYPKSFEHVTQKSQTWVGSL